MDQYNFDYLLLDPPRIGCHENVLEAVRKLKPRKIIINHGESSKTLDLASSLHRANRIETISPQNLETIRIR